MLLKLVTFALAYTALVFTAVDEPTIASVLLGVLIYSLCFGVDYILERIDKTIK